MRGNIKIQKVIKKFRFKSLHTSYIAKMSVRISAVDASDEERVHLPKGDGKPKRPQRYRWI